MVSTSGRSGSPSSTDDLNVPKAGPLAWTALSGALAYKALN